MNLGFPFPKFPMFRGNSFYRKSHYNHNLNKTSTNNNKKNELIFSPPKNEKSHTEQEASDDKNFFDIFGIRLYHDDILLLSLIFCLYNEGVEDTGLFIALILLLLN